MPLAAFRCPCGPASTKKLPQPLASSRARSMPIQGSSRLATVIEGKERAWPGWARSRQARTSSGRSTSAGATSSAPATGQQRAGARVRPTRGDGEAAEAVRREHHRRLGAADHLVELGHPGVAVRRVPHAELDSAGIGAGLLPERLPMGGPRATEPGDGEDDRGMFVERSEILIAIALQREGRPDLQFIPIELVGNKPCDGMMASCAGPKRT